MTTYQYRVGQTYRTTSGRLVTVHGLLPDNYYPGHASRYAYVHTDTGKKFTVNPYGQANFNNGEFLQLTTLVADVVDQPDPSPNYEIRTFADLILGQKFRFAELGAPKPGLYRKVDVVPDRKHAWCAEIDFDHNLKRVYKTDDTASVIPCNTEGRPSRRRRSRHKETP